MKHLLNFGIIIFSLLLFSCANSEKDSPQDQVNLPKEIDTEETASQTSSNRTASQAMSQELIQKTNEAFIWEVFLSLVLKNGISLQLQKPKEATVQSLPNGIAVKYTGSESANETEITDGFLISIRIKDSEVQEFLKKNKSSGTAKTLTIAGRPAYTYSPGSESGIDNTHYVYALPESPGSIAHIVVNKQPSSSELYEMACERILNSIKWRN